MDEQPFQYGAQGNLSREREAELTERVSAIESLTRAILVVILISLVSIILSATALVLDQVHFNNQVYRESRTTGIP